MARIILVDDDIHMLQLTKSLVEKGAHTAIRVRDPLEAIATIRAEEPDLAIIDVMMPQLNGYELCRQIRNEEDIAHLPIVMLTARAQEFDRQAALESGADAFLGKPVNSTELLKTLHRLLERDAPEAGGQVVALFGLRGGAGRTTLSVNLAGALRRLSADDVAIVDLAPTLGQVALHLRLRPRASWAEKVETGERGWEDLDSLLTAHPAGLFLAAAPSFPASPRPLGAARCHSLLAALRSRFSFTIIDLPARYDETVHAALESADTVLHVVAPDLFGIEVARRTTKGLARAGLARGRLITVTNQHLPGAKLSPALLAKGLGAPPDLQIAYDENQAQAFVRGRPLALGPEETALSRAVRALARLVQPPPTQARQEAFVTEYVRSAVPA